MKINQSISSIVSGICLLALTACQTSSQTRGTAIGAGVGGGLGAIAGNNIKGISKTEGAIVGAVVGGLLGNQSGRKQDQINNLQGQVNQNVVNVRNRNGSVTPVILYRSGNGWQGPRGEVYTNLPSEGQLKQAYGF
ncbi:MAG: hypothetical protein ACI8XO_001347 [Verrucomicrobiales bacterium]|jgi:hypothetical protein